MKDSKSLIMFAIKKLVPPGKILDNANIFLIQQKIYLSKTFFNIPLLECNDYKLYYNHPYSAQLASYIDEFEIFKEEACISDSDAIMSQYKMFYKNAITTVNSFEHSQNINSKLTIFEWYGLISNIVYDINTQCKNMTAICSYFSHNLYTPYKLVPYYIDDEYDYKNALNIIKHIYI